MSPSQIEETKDPPSPSPPHIQAWQYLASLLHTRNRSLEHQTSKLQDLNASLEADIEWLVSALARAEEEIVEVRMEAAAMREESLKCERERRWDGRVECVNDEEVDGRCVCEARCEERFRCVR